MIPAQSLYKGSVLIVAGFESALTMEFAVISLLARAIGAARSVALGARAAIFATGARLSFHIAFRFGSEHLSGEAVFTGLLIDFDEFHSDLIAFVETALVHRVEAVP